MAEFTIYLGNKNYSSWSLRGWLALEQTGAKFTERVFNIADPAVRDDVRRVSPTVKVPALAHGDRVLWDSLAIAEYLAESFPDAGLWPPDTGARAIARAAVAEMHASFTALRTYMPMNVRRSSPGQGRAAGVQQDIDRIRELWRDCREQFGDGGAFLFGAWCLADAFYAPVTCRFVTYEVELDASSRAYVEAVQARPAMRRWRDDARAEPWSNPAYDL